MRRPVPSTCSPSLSLLSHTLFKTTHCVTAHRVFHLPGGHTHIPLFLFLPIHAQMHRLHHGFPLIAQVCSDALEIPSLTVMQASDFLFFFLFCCFGLVFFSLLFTCCLWFMILQSLFCSEAECCPASCCLLWFPAIYWDKIAMLFNSLFHPLASSPGILGVRPI